MRQMKLIAELARLKIARATAFRLGFFGPLLVDGSMFILQMVMFSSIYSHVDSIAGWGKGQTLMFVGTYSLINALNMTIFFFGVNGIPDLIKNGDFDGYLTKPVNALFRLTFENINLGSSPLILLSIAMIIYGARLAGAVVAPGALLGYVALVIIMLLLYYDIMIIIRTIPFFVISAGSIVAFESSMLEMCMLIPGVAFKGAFKIIFQLILPYGIIATVPVQFFTGMLSLAALIHSLGVVAVFTIFALWFFKFGSKRYKSASS